MSDASVAHGVTSAGIPTGILVDSDGKPVISPSSNVAQTDADGSLSLEQTNDDKGFVDYIGNSEAGVTKPISTYTAGNTIQGFTRVEINGTAYWMPFYDAPTS